VWIRGSLFHLSPAPQALAAGGRQACRAEAREVSGAAERVSARDKFLDFTRTST
jgi:hypothetical protein